MKAQAKTDLAILDLVMDRIRAEQHRTSTTIGNLIKQDWQDKAAQNSWLDILECYRKELIQLSESVLQQGTTVVYALETFGCRMDRMNDPSNEYHRAYSDMSVFIRETLYQISISK